MKAQFQSLEQMYSQPNCWRKSTVPLVRFWLGDGSCWGFPFFAVVATRYVPDEQRLLIYFTLGTVIILGPKAHEFFDDFSNHRATELKADGNEIVSVKIDLNMER